MKFNCSYDELLDINDPKIIPNPKNNNKHPADQIDRLAKIIEFQGQRSPIVISKQSGFVTKGHARLEAIKLLGWKQIAVNFQEYESDAQEYADMTADNAIASWAEIDLNAIVSELPSFEGLDLDLLGIKNFELPEVVEPGSDEDEVPEAAETRCKPGDVWALGGHRLMCGDSTSIDAVEKLMNGEKADMVFTDPPYGINESGDRSKRNGKNSLKQGVKYENFKDDSIQYAIDAFNLCNGLRHTISNMVGSKLLLPFYSTIK